MLKTCVICNIKIAALAAATSDTNRHEDAESPVATKQFFQLLERYLGRNYFGGVGEKEDEEAMRNLLEQVIGMGFKYCAECSKIVESFCQLYEQLKTIQLQLRGKVGALKTVLVTALEIPVRMEDFEENGKLIEIEDVGTEEIIDLIMDFKRDLIKKCDEKLKTSFPRLELENCSRKSKEGEVSLATSQVSSTSSDVQEKGTTSVQSSEDQSHQRSTADSSELMVGQRDDNDDFSNYSPPSPQVPSSKLSYSSLKAQLYAQTASNICNRRRNLRPAKPKRKVRVDKRMGISTASIPPPIPSHRVRWAPKSIVDPVTGKHKCSLCPMEFINSGRCGIHYRQFHLKLKYKCSICKQDYSTPEVYRTHYQSMHSGVKIMCQTCGKSFGYKGSFNDHLRATTCGAPEDAIAKCKICGKQFTKHTSLRTHIKAVHEKVRDQLCDICGVGYKMKGDLNRHRQRVHFEILEARKAAEQEQLESQNDSLKLDS